MRTLRHYRRRRAYMRRWAQDKKLQCLNAYGGAVCVLCGYKGHALGLDHINGNGREHRAGDRGTMFYRRLIRANFPRQPQLRVLCFNCNWSEHQRKQESQVQLVDMLGTDIKAGDTIVYPGRSGSSLWMNHAEVVSLGDGNIRVRHKTREIYNYADRKCIRIPAENAKESTITVLDRVVVL